MAKTKTIENLFVSVDLYASLLPVFFFILYWKQSKQEIGLRLLVIYSLLAFIIDKILLITVLPIIYQFYTILEFSLFAGFFYTQIHAKRVRRVMVGSVIFFALFGLVFPLLWHGQLLIDSIPIGVETIIILVFAFYYLYEKTNDTTTLFIYSTYPFWMVMGIVLFLSGSFFTYIFASSLSKQEIGKYWVITNVFSILRTLFFCTGIIINSKPQKKLPSELHVGSLN